MPQAPSTRWCPTPEQLMILEEMYRSGVRTPNASQIQQITAHLSYYGKIEGKNVFYWFQNHKARDRQKLRRRLSRQHQFLHQHGHSSPHPLHLHILEESPLLPSYQLQQQTQPQFLHQGFCQETTQGLNLLCQLETGAGSKEVEAPVTSGGCGGTIYDWMTMMGHIEPILPPCCRPLKTLDLFPTNSTGLKDECCSTSKSCPSSLPLTD